MNVSMKWIAIALVLAGFANCGGKAAPPAAQPLAAKETLEFEPAIPITVLRGENNLKVELVPLKVAGDEAPAALVRVTGMYHPLAGVTFRATRKISSANAEMWTVRLEDSDYTLLRRRVKVPEVTLLQLPPLNQSIALRADLCLNMEAPRVKGGYLCGGQSPPHPFRVLNLSWRTRDGELHRPEARPTSEGHVTFRSLSARMRSFAATVIVT